MSAQQRGLDLVEDFFFFLSNKTTLKNKEIIQGNKVVHRKYTYQENLFHRKYNYEPLEHRCGWCRVNHVNTTPSTSKFSWQCTKEPLEHQNLSSQKVQLSRKPAKELKLKTPKAFVYSSKVWRKDSCKSWVDLSFSSKVRAFLSRHIPHMRQRGIILQINTNLRLISLLNQLARISTTPLGITNKPQIKRIPQSNTNPSQLLNASTNYWLLKFSPKLQSKERN